MLTSLGVEIDAATAEKYAVRSPGVGLKKNLLESDAMFCIVVNAVMAGTSRQAAEVANCVAWPTVSQPLALVQPAHWVDVAGLEPTA